MENHQQPEEQERDEETKEEEGELVRDPNDLVAVSVTGNQNSVALDTDIVAKLQKENLRLKLEAQRSNIGRGNRKKKAQGKQKKTPWEREVEYTVNTVLWKQCKNITTSTKLVKASKIVFKNLETTEYDHMEPDSDEYKLAKEEWVSKNADMVVEALNSHRNYCVGEIRGHMMDVFRDGKEKEYPNKEDILLCILRDAEIFLGKDKEKRKLYLQKQANVHDKLIPKVAGKDRWCPTKRHYGGLSSAAPRGM